MMTPAVFEQKLRHLLAKKPFQPFIIEFDDDDRFVVGEPEAIWYHDGGSAVYFRLDGSFDFVNCEAVRQFVVLLPVASA